MGERRRSRGRRQRPRAPWRTGRSGSRSCTSAHRPGQRFDLTVAFSSPAASVSPAFAISPMPWTARVVSSLTSRAPSASTFACPAAFFSASGTTSGCPRRDSAAMGRTSHPGPSRSTFRRPGTCRADTYDLSVTGDRQRSQRSRPRSRRASRAGRRACSVWYPVQKQLASTGSVIAIRITRGWRECH